MNLPTDLHHFKEWVFLGPMGPALPDFLKSLPIIGVDGGGNFSDKLDLWIGDADSINKNVLTPNKIQLSKDKDKSDLAAGFELFEDLRLHIIHLWGFMGGRRDHELFNLGEALKFLENKQFCQIKFYEGTPRVIYHLVGPGKWDFIHKGTFSLGTHKSTKIKMFGDCHFKVLDFSLLECFSSFGLSNMAHGKFQIEAEGPVFIYYPEAK